MLAFLLRAGARLRNSLLRQIQASHISKRTQAQYCTRCFQDSQFSHTSLAAGHSEFRLDPASLAPKVLSFYILNYFKSPLPRSIRSSPFPPLSLAPSRLPAFPPPPLSACLARKPGGELRPATAKARSMAPKVKRATSPQDLLSLSQEISISGTQILEEMQSTLRGSFSKPRNGAKRPKLAAGKRRSRKGSGT